MNIKKILLILGVFLLFTNMHYAQNTGQADTLINNFKQKGFEGIRNQMTQTGSPASQPVRAQLPARQSKPTPGYSVWMGMTIGSLQFGEY